MTSSFPCLYCDPRRGRDPTHLQNQGDQAASILERIRMMESLIGDIHQERARLLRGLNATYSSTKDLPPEILSRIFRLVIASPAERTLDEEHEEFPNNSIAFLLVLGAVSSHWRAVAWTTPKLWAKVTLEPTVGGAEGAAFCFKTCMENTRSVSVDLDFQKNQSIQIPKSWLERSDDAMESVKSALFSEGTAGKIKSLELIAPPPAWLPLIRKNCSALRRLSLSWPSWLGGRGVYTGQQFSPILKSRLSEPWSETQLPWTTITTLELMNVPIDISLNLLIQCPNLISYSCLRPWLLWVGPEKYLSQVVILPHLQSLKWEYRPNRWHECLLRFVQFPALRRLVWVEGCPVSQAYPSGFFSKLPSTLETFELHGRRDRHPLSVQPLDAALKCSRNLANLIFINCPPTAWPYALGLLRHPGLLSTIRSMTWNGPYAAPANQLDETFVCTVEEMRLAGVESFTLNLANVEPLSWELKTWETLRQLAGEGFLKLSVNSEPFRWSESL